MRLKFHTDPEHGWIEVKRMDLRRLGLLNKISSYSFQNADSVFLEQDVDAALFVRAFERSGSTKIEFIECHREVTPIRNYMPYKR